MDGVGEESGHAIRLEEDPDDADAAVCAGGSFEFRGKKGRFGFG